MFRIGLLTSITFPLTTRGLFQLLLCSLLLLHPFEISAKTPEYDQQVWNAAGMEMQVYSYRPASCKSHDILFVFHGLKRNAKGLRDRAVKVAQKVCLAVFAPLFDKDRFPNWRYHRAGVVHDERIQPKSRWTEPILRALLSQARREIGRDDARLYLFGHSAGGQFLSRISAFSLSFDADRIIIANPSVHVVPTVSEAVPYGFGGLFEGEEAEVRIRQYLELPISIYLGQEDTKKKYLVLNDSAKKQGINRLDRGRNIFSRARQLAEERNWTFNWRLVEAPGVGHSSKGMLKAPEMITALGRDESE